MTAKIKASAVTIVAAGSIIAAAAAQAGPLTIIDVAAPAVNCVFNTTGAPNCTVTVNDSVGTFTPPGDSGNARLQSRTFPGQTLAPAHGATAYLYRVDLTEVKGVTAANCVTKLVLDFGRVLPLPYSPKGRFGVFVVTSGGLGSIGLSSADQDQFGNVTTFTFSSPVCPGATSYFFGLASESVPVAGTAHVFFSLGGSTTTADRVPTP